MMIKLRITEIITIVKAISFPLMLRYNAIPKINSSIINIGLAILNKAYKNIKIPMKTKKKI